jgi:hypothetical protein
MRALCIFALCFCVGSLIGAAIPVPGASAAKPPAGQSGVTTVERGDTAGTWATCKNADVTAAVYADSEQGAVLAVGKSTFNGGYDFAIAKPKNDGEVYFQIRDSEGKIHHVPVSKLLKLRD